MKKKKKRLNLSASHRELLSSHSETKDKIESFLKKWQQNLWLGQWKIDVMYEWNGIHDMNPNTVATCESDWRYMEATLRFDLTKLCLHSDEVVEKTVLHELLHAVLNEMREGHISHEERVASHLTQVLYYLK